MGSISGVIGWATQLLSCSGSASWSGRGGHFVQQQTGLYICLLSTGRAVAQAPRLVSLLGWEPKSGRTVH